MTRKEGQLGEAVLFLLADLTTIVLGAFYGGQMHLLAPLLRKIDTGII